MPYNDPKTEYIQGLDKISLRGLAEKWQVPFRTVAEHSRKEGWVEERKIYRNEVATQTRKKGIESRAEQSREIRSNLYETLFLLSKALLSNLRECNFENLKCVKIGSEALSNVWTMYETLFLNEDEKGQITCEMFARALEVLEEPLPR